MNNISTSNLKLKEPFFYNHQKSIDTASPKFYSCLLVCRTKDKILLQEKTVRDKELLV